MIIGTPAVGGRRGEWMHHERARKYALRQAECPSNEGSSIHATRRLSEALAELMRSSANCRLLHETRAAVQTLSDRLDHRLFEETDERKLSSHRMSAMEHSVDRLVTHMQGLSELMAELLQHLSPGSVEPENNPQVEPAFQPGGEGIDVMLTGVSRFQDLVDIERAFIAMGTVAGASVERYQERESRLRLQLRTAVTQAQLVRALTSAGLNVIVEEARPETGYLHLRLM
jgi:hypothetical protein